MASNSQARYNFVWRCDRIVASPGRSEGCCSKIASQRNRTSTKFIWTHVTKILHNSSPTTLVVRQTWTVNIPVLKHNRSSFWIVTDLDCTCAISRFVCVCPAHQFFFMASWWTSRKRLMALVAIILTVKQTWHHLVQDLPETSASPDSIRYHSARKVYRTDSFHKA